MIAVIIFSSAPARCFLGAQSILHHEDALGKTTDEDVHSLLTEPMPELSPQARIVLTTVASPEEAERLGRALVEERLAACVTILPSAQSIYPWEGRVESSAESLLVIKTVLEQLDVLETRLHELHSYQTPEFVVLEVSAMSHGYLEWIKGCLLEP